jgi:hypothetical protein
MSQSSQLSHFSLPAELPYFAIARDDWELLLLRARQLGADTIAAHVPWAWHALAPDTFDFDGATDERRDLAGFVRQCDRFGLRVLLDPGPRHDTLVGSGTPAWLLQQHPDARALGPAGSPWLDAAGLPYPSALHPEFLSAARAWIAAFSSAMRTLQAPAGPIVALHIGAVGSPERPDHNHAAGAFGDMPAPVSAGPADFVAWYEGAAAATTIDWLRADGWSVPLRRASPQTSPGGEQPVVRSGAADWLSQPSVYGWHSDTSILLTLRHNGSHARHLAGQATDYLSLTAAPNHPLLNPANLPATALLRADGSARPEFWRVKMGRLLLSTADADTIGAGAPADLALAGASALPDLVPADAGILELRQRLRQANVAFSLIDVDTATPQELASYALIILPSTLALQPATQQKLAQYSNLVLLGDQAHADTDDLRGAGDLIRSPAHPLTPTAEISADISADQVAELIEQRGGIARYAWADGDHVDLAVHYSDRHTYLSIHNRRSAAYNGILAYRGRDGAVLHLHSGIGAGRAGLVLLEDDEVYGAAIDGDGAEGGWLARGLRSSAVFNSGAGALARCGAGLLLTASQSGRFQARRSEGWPELQAYRLLIGGALLPAQAQIDATHISVAYVAEDDAGQTDLYLVLPTGDIPPLVRSYLAAPLAARAEMLRRAVMHARKALEQADSLEAQLVRAIELLTAAAERLDAGAQQLTELEEYRAAWSAADDLCQTAISALAQALAQARGALLLGQREPAAHEALERWVASIFRLISLNKS